MEYQGAKSVGGGGGGSGACFVRIRALSVNQVKLLLPRSSLEELQLARIYTRNRTEVPSAPVLSLNARGISEELSSTAGPCGS